MWHVRLEQAGQCCSLHGTLSSCFLTLFIYFNLFSRVFTLFLCLPLPLPPLSLSLSSCLFSGAVGYRPFFSCISLAAIQPNFYLHSSYFVFWLRFIEIADHRSCCCMFPSTPGVCFLTFLSLLILQG